MGTLIIFISFILSFITLIATFSIPNIKFLLLPLTIFLGIALLNAVVYLNDIIKLKEGEVESSNDQIELKTCPEYWVKDTMYVDEQPVDICRNYKAKEDDPTVIEYVGGSTAGSNSFLTNHNQKHMSATNTSELLNSMNADANDANADANANAEEGFQDFDASTYRGNKFLDEDAPDNGNTVVYPSLSNNEESYSNSNLIDIPGRHYHYISHMEDHSNSDAIHTGFEGAGYHWHNNNQSPINGKNILSEECASNWICESIPDNGIVININDLNTQSNNELCNNTNQFYWVEAANKCKFNNL
jgi:hypothetical protein